MDEKFNTILSPMEQAWTFAKVDMNSNYFKEFKGLSNMNRVRTLYDYYKAQDFREGEIKDGDLKDSDKTKNYFVITMDDPTGRSANGTIDLIVDASGHDVAITYVGDDGVKFEISPDIIKNNAEMLKNLDLGINMNPSDVAKMMAPKDMDALVREIEKHDTVAMRSSDDAKVRADEYDKERATNATIDAKEKGREEKEAEIDAELKENSDIPQEMYSDIHKICMENDLNPKDLKQSLTIVDPGELIGQIDNSITDVRENGGEVTVLRFKNKEAGAGADRIFMVQGGQLLRADEKNDQKMSELMEEHKGNGVKVEDFEDTRIEELEARLQALQEEYQAKKDQIEQNYHDVELTNTFTAEKRDLACEESINNLKSTYKGEVEAICNEYMPPKTAEIQSVEDATKNSMEVGEQEKAEAVPSKEESEEEYHPNDPIYKRLFGSGEHN